MLFFLILSMIYRFFVIKYQLIDNDNIIFGSVFPALTSGLITYFVLRQRLKLLQVTDKYLQFILLSGWLLMTAPVITYQYYTYFESGKLTELENAYDILDAEHTTFYSIKNTSQRKDMSAMYVTNVHHVKEPVICVNSYFVCPLINSNDSTDIRNVWISFNIGERFSDRVFDDKEKQKRLVKNFVDSTVTVYKNHNFSTNYLKRLSSSTELDGFVHALKKVGLSNDIESAIILKEQNGDYETRTGKSLWWTKFFLLTSNIMWILLTIFPKMKNAL